MMYWGNHMSTGDWIFSILGTLIVVALIIIALVWLFSALGERGRNGEDPPSAHEILSRRLANGEITVDQYEQLRDKLDEHPSSTRDPGPPRPASVPS